MQTARYFPCVILCIWSVFPRSFCSFALVFSRVHREVWKGLCKISWILKIFAKVSWSWQ